MQKAEIVTLWPRITDQNSQPQLDKKIKRSGVLTFAFRKQPHISQYRPVKPANRRFAGAGRAEEDPVQANLNERFLLELTFVVQLYPIDKPLDAP